MTPTALLLIIRIIWHSLITDRVVVTGATTGGSTLGAAKLAHSTTIEHLLALQPYVVFFATLAGALVSVATFIYVCIKIRRLLKNPAAIG